ncbi:MAG: alpha-L-fucosidase [Gemmatimonadota bacterium]
MRFLFCSLLAFVAPSLAAQAPYTPSAENLAAREHFQDNKLGMFIHWGPAMVLQDGEWVMENRHITVKEYETLPPLFNPVQFNADAWVRLAKESGLRYITLITKHHDGFALWDSKVNDWNIMMRTPFKRDIVKEMSEACQRAGMPLFLYYSQLDWYNTNYFPRGQTGHGAGRPESGDFNRYLDDMDAQLTELLTHYGPIAGIWFDGMWDRPEAEWRLRQTYDLIHRLQPAALVGSNHHKAPFPGEDFQMFEKDLPGANSAGFNTTHISELPHETAETIADSWGFRLTDRGTKSLDRLVRYVVSAVGVGANFLLNVGPMPIGAIYPEHAARMRELGGWLREHGEAIYGTRAGPIGPRPWGVTSAKGNRVFVHVLDWPDRELTLPAVGSKVIRATLLIGGTAVPVRPSGDGVKLELPPRGAGEIDQIVVLELAPRS